MRQPAPEGGLPEPLSRTSAGGRRLPCPRRPGEGQRGESRAIRSGRSSAANGHRGNSIRCKADLSEGRKEARRSTRRSCARAKAQARHPALRRSLWGVGPGILEGSLAKRVRESDRTYFGRPLRRRIHRPRLFRRDLAHVHRPDTGRQHPAAAACPTCASNSVAGVDERPRLVAVLPASPNGSAAAVLVRHWINAPCFLMLLMSAPQVFDARPALR